MLGKTEEPIFLSSSTTAHYIGALILITTQF